MAITFDTLKFVETLEQAGVDRKQASAFASAVRDSHDVADVATKGDIALVHKELDLIRKEIALARRDTIIWLGGMLVAGFGLVLRYVA